MSVIVLEEIEPIQGDTFDTMHYVACDCCGDFAHADVMNGVPHRPWYRVHGENLIVCVNCIPSLD